MHVGFTLRLLRTTAGISLRTLAERVGVSSAYLSRVEHGHDPAPTPDRLVSIARCIGVDPRLLIDLVGGARSLFESYVRTTPEADALFREIARRGLSAQQIARLRACMEQEFPSLADPARPIHRVLRIHGIILQLECEDYAEAVSLGARRLPLPAQQRDAVVTAMTDDHARDGALVGNGVAVPSSVVASAPEAMALLTLATPMKATTPDGVPLSVILLVTAKNGYDRLNLLTQAARLADAAFVRRLRQATSAETAMRLLTDFELAP